MDKDKLAKRLLATFQGEIPEHVGALNENLLALEKDPSGPGAADRIKSLFRAAHSLKGAARSVSLHPIEQMCHHLEEVLRAIQGGTVPLGEETFALLFAAADALDDARTRLTAEQDLAGGPLEQLATRLAAVAEPHAKTRPLEPLRPRRASSGETRARAAPASSPPRGTGTPAREAPPAAGPLPGAEPSGVPGGDGVIRVAAAKVDTLLIRSGELLVAQGRLERAEAGVAAVGEALARLHRDWKRGPRTARAPEGAKRSRNGAEELDEMLGTVRAELERVGVALLEDRRAMSRSVALMDEAVRHVRLIPFAEACQALDRTVRDLAKTRGKEVDVVVAGASIEVDRSILEGLRDPLLSLARNAVDHGIELPAARRAAGKPERGRIVVASALRGSRIEVSVADDGAGVDVAAVRERARQRGLSAPDDDRQAFALLFESGFSTAEHVTEISGRGVGLDIVKTRAEALQGTVEIASERGLGTRVTLTLPGTLTTLRALLVAAGGEIFAIPANSLVRMVRMEPGGIRSVGGREVIPGGEGPPIPIFPLERVLGLREGTAPKRKILAVVVGRQAQVALAVDELIAEREVLVKALGPRLGDIRHIVGGTILETGRVALILNVNELGRSALERPGESALATHPETTEARKRILLADDSATTRSLERSILEAAGYEVLTAVDGEQAFHLLYERGADLLVSDVDMPRMDGMSLCKKVRASKRFRDLPVVLVTGLESEQDRARGAEAGADAYLVKSEFDQRNLLSTISVLLGGGS